MADLKISNGRYTVDPLYQWDINQTLKIYGLSIQNPEIHFTSEAMGGTLVVEPTVDESGVITVNVPNSLLQFNYSIVAYVTGFEDKTFKTYHKVTIPVKARKRPGDYTLSLSDNEVYSFKNMDKRISNIENEIQSEGSILYTYTYDADKVTLVEASGKKTIGQYLPLVSNSMKAIKSLTDKFKTLIDDNTKLGNMALSIAKGINQAMVFSTTADMNAWLSNEANKGKAKVGNNLYIVDVGVPDWWIAEVLETPDSETGFYYKIAQLETQKVDLTNIESDIDTLQSDVGALNTNVTSLTTQSNDTKNRVTNLEKMLVPKQVSEVSYTKNDTGYILTWEAPATYNIECVGYNIYKCESEVKPNSFSDYELVGTTTDLTYEISNINATTFILIASVNKLGSVNEDISYTNVLLPTNITFRSATWSQIGLLCDTGDPTSFFSIGDTKSVDINGASYTLQIYDFNHDDLFDGSGKAKMTIGLMNCLSSTLKMNSTGSGSATNSGGWRSSVIYSYLNNSIYNLLPDDLKAIIKTVGKKTSVGNGSSDITTTSNKLFLPSEIEVFNSATYSRVGEGTVYPIFNSGTYRFKKLGDSGSNTDWWLRSPYYSNSMGFCIVNSSAVNSYSGSNNTYGVSFAFCI